jgi:hypothetical protein
MVIHPTTRDEGELYFGHIRNNSGTFSGVLRGRMIGQRFVNRPEFARMGLNGDRIKLTNDAWCDVSLKVSVRTLPLGTVGKGRERPVSFKKTKGSPFFLLPIYLRHDLEIEHEFRVQKSV